MNTHAPPGQAYFEHKITDIDAQRPLVGQVWLCKTCNIDLCFKCIRHREKMDDAKHEFVDLDEFLREQSVDEVDADRSEHGGKSRNGSENEEEEDESESESEEDEDDESE